MKENEPLSIHEVNDVVPQTGGLRRRQEYEDTGATRFMTNLIMFILGGALVWTLFSWTPIGKRGTKFDAQKEEATFKKGVEWGINGAIFCVNKGITNIPRDELVVKAWELYKVEKQ